MQQIVFLLPWIRTHWLALLFSITCATVGVALDHVSPWILKLILENPTSASSWKWIFTAVIAILLSGIFGYVQRILMATFGRRIESDIRSDLFQRILLQPVQFFQKRNPGHVLQNLVQDLEKLQELTGPALLHFYRTGLTLVFTTVLLFQLSPSLATWGFVFFCILAYASLFLMAKVYQGHRKIRESHGVMGGFVRDYLNGFSTAKATGSNRYFSEKQGAISEKIRVNTLHISILTSLIWPFITLLCGIGIAGAVALGYHQVTQGVLSTGALAAAALYLVRAQYPLVGLGIMAAMVQRGRASLDRILELRNSFAPSTTPDAETLESFSGITIQNLHFQYEDAAVFSMDEIHLSLLPGKRLGIVGDTGSGKSTLARLIAGILPVPKSTYLLNGVDLANLQEDSLHGSWRSLFSYAPQDGILFSWTIQKNIELGRTENTQKDAAHYAELAGLTPDLANMPEGLDTRLGERGVNVSGGQKQRIGLARALMHMAPVTVLDDVFSALDPTTEDAVIQSIRNLEGLHSFVIVSHRYTSVMHCDEILFLQNGRIVERGSHSSLLNQNGNYATNWLRQQAGRES